MYLAIILVKVDTTVIVVTMGIITPMIIRDPVDLKIPTADNLNPRIILGTDLSPRITVNSPVIGAGRKVILDPTVPKMVHECSQPKS